ncbi:WD repeat-containing protein 97-like isoform X2 [Trachemys scripta elegans]|uniref:WD repeat-containing protein 97-like isoform X2 n=1 Tax=Trachemys scripta elegans TaxID=31138 RepID=UPI0015557B08|nr:WD repeat-containing protein 97-like isoform X2 [Trachemys scripta elegans]
MSLPDPVQDSPFPLSDSSLRPLNKDARQRLLLEPRSLAVKLCVPLLRWKPKKDEDLSWARQEKEEACAQLAARDQDLLLLQQGKLSAARKPKLNKKLRDEAFERYMHLVYRQPRRIQIPHNDSFDADMVLEACLLSPLVPKLYGPTASRMFLGAFLDGAEENAERPMLKAPAADGVCREDALEPRAGRGSRLALPTPSASKGLEDSLRRSSLARIRSQISQARQEAAAASESQHTGSRSRSSSLQITRVNGHGPSTSQESSHLHVRRLSSGFLPNSVVVQQFRSQDDIESARESLLAMWLEVQQDQAGRAGPERGEELLGTEEEEDEAARTAAILEKISSISLPVPKWKESVTSFFLTQPDEFEQPQASPSGGEIPSFVLQFEDTEWFRQIYPVLSSMDSLQGLSVSRFVRRLLEALLTVDDGAKTDIVQAILTLHEQLGVENGREVCKALLLILNQSDPPRLEEKTQKKFVLTSLNALMAFCRDSKELLLELMAYFLHSPVSSREKPVTKAALRRICAQWLEGVMQDFQDHKSSTLEPFQARAGKRHFPGSSPKAKKAAGRSRVSPSAGSPEPSVGPINAINHFCKVQMKRDLEDLKQPKPAGAQETKNTVMALPSTGRSQAILRLGETNTMARRRPSQRFYLPRIFPLPLLTGFVHAIKLPVPRINVNPFPPDSDMPASPNTFISMQQKVQKYFIPKFSLADSYP